VKRLIILLLSSKPEEMIIPDFSFKDAVYLDKNLQQPKIMTSL
jgi:hypothetical protein